MVSWIHMDIKIRERFHLKKFADLRIDAGFPCDATHFDGQRKGDNKRITEKREKEIGMEKRKRTEHNVNFITDRMSVYNQKMRKTN